ncbi:MAG: phosphotransferase [FCB group bacterium]|nr:phosphotransferase [FCB group bacterium]
MSRGRPQFDKGRVLTYLQRHYGLTGTLKQLGSYDDQNFLLKTPFGKSFICKISRAGTANIELAAQNEAMRLLAETLPEALFPRVVPNLAGREICSLAENDASENLLRVLTYIEGTLLKEDNTPPLGRHLAFGRFLGQMDQVLLQFDHPGTHRNFSWDLRHTLHLRESVSLLADSEKEGIVHGFLDLFKDRVVPLLPVLRKCVIHNDANDTNILWLGKGSKKSWRFGVIDFGDLTFTHLVFEVAIAAAYAMLGKADPLDHALAIVQGYHEVLPLTDRECEILYLLMCCRICMSVVLGKKALLAEPDNLHLKLTEAPGWELLDRLAAEDFSETSRRFCQVCRG